MPELTKEEKLKIFSQLPPKLQEVMFSDATADTIDRIGKKYGLDDEKISLLAEIIGDIILGITPITSLAQEISSKIISDTQAAANLTQELNTDLLTPVMAPTISQPTVTKPTDKYREPTMPIPATPEIIDLRNQPKKVDLLIEADPHKIPTHDAYREPVPQYIMRPSGTPPTDKGEL